MEGFYTKGTLEHFAATLPDAQRRLMMDAVREMRYRIFRGVQTVPAAATLRQLEGLGIDCDNLVVPSQSRIRFMTTNDYADTDIAFAGMLND